MYMMAKCGCSYVLWMGWTENHERGQDEWTGGGDGMHGTTVAILFREGWWKVPDGDVRKFPGLHEVNMHDALVSRYAHMFLCEGKEKMCRRKERNPWATWEGALEERSTTTSIHHTLPHTWTPAGLCASLLQLLNEGSDNFFLDFL